MAVVQDCCYKQVWVIKNNLNYKIMFKKRKWSKWEHISFVQDFRSGIKTVELLRREDEITGLVEWKRIYVKDCVHNLVSLLSNLWDKRSTCL